MKRRLTYRDSIAALGDAESSAVKAIDKLLGGLILTSGAVFPSVLSLLGAKNELVKRSDEIILRLQKSTIGANRLQRLERVAAAHTLTVVCSFFEAVDLAQLPFNLKNLEITRNDQLFVANVGAGPSGHPTRKLLDTMISFDVPAPSGTQTTAEYDRDLYDYFTKMGQSFLRLCTGLAVWDRLSDRQIAKIRESLQSHVPHRAMLVYSSRRSELVGKFPEVQYWIEASIVRKNENSLGKLELSLARLENQANLVSSTRPHAQDSIIAANRAALRKSLANSADAPSGITLPTVEEGYVDSRYRVASAELSAPISDESWWDEHDVKCDLPGLLTSYLTNPRDLLSPMVILGQPGSGKSMLTQVLSARLPPTDYFVVRVPLREVPADASVREQVEQAIRNETGEIVSWPDLARSLDGRIAVVVLDGFDELLQASGVSQTDYLVRCAEFQESELDQGRAVGVVVTSRTAVAERARLPRHCIVVKLEPFSDEQVDFWLETWNRCNSTYMQRHEVRPLTAQDLRTHKSLAEQPLLLLMLAIYDIEGNALKEGVLMTQSQLYERLLVQFADREVEKNHRSKSEDEKNDLRDLHLTKLSVVALAMFNRSSLWVSESDLSADLESLLPESKSSKEVGDFKPSRRASEEVLSGFFFVQRSRVNLGRETESTWEFLHATFAEYLVARLSTVLLGDALDRASSKPKFGTRARPDSYMAEHLSFECIASRSTILQFISDQLSWRDLGATTSSTLRGFMVEALEGAGIDASGGDRGRQANPIRRVAIYSLNLLILRLLIAGAASSRTLFAGQDPVAEWQSAAALWRSQLRVEEWVTLVNTLQVERTWNESAQRDIRVALRADRQHPDPVPDPRWVFAATERESASAVYSRFAPGGLEHLRRSFNLLALPEEDVLLHALEPALEAYPELSALLLKSSSHGLSSSAYEVQRLLTGAIATNDRRGRREIYERCWSLFREQQQNGVSNSTLSGIRRAIYKELRVDHEASSTLVLTIFERVGVDADSAAVALRVLLDFFGREPALYLRQLSLIREILAFDLAEDLLFEAWLTLAQYSTPAESELIALIRPRVALGALYSRRPDLKRRGKIVFRGLD